MSLKHYEALRDEELFHNSIHALSLLDFHWEIGRDTPAFNTSDVTTIKHVNMLEGLALLLVSREKTDVAATSMLLETDRVKIFWARNANIVATAAERTYIRELIAMFARGALINEIVCHVAPYCHRKIVSRCKKLSSAFPSGDLSKVFEDYQGNGDYGPLERNLKERNFLGNAELLHVTMGKFMKQVRETNFATSSALVIKVLHFSYGLTAVRPTIKSMVTDIQWNRLRKVADYRSCSEKTREAVAALRPQARNNIIDIQLLASKNIKTVDVHSGLVAALNTWCGPYPRNTPIPNFEKLRLFFGNPNPGPSSHPTTTISTAQHAELTVAIHLVEYFHKRKTQGVIKLGVSKASCYWCQTYLKSLNNMVHSDGVEIVNRATHGKCADGWPIPEWPGGVRREVLDHIGDLMQDVFDTVNIPRRKSDSVPLAGQSGDETWQREDEPMFG